MPLPKPKEDESKEQFTSRCMSDPVMSSEFSDRDQRLAVCSRQWDRGRASIEAGLGDRDLMIRSDLNSDFVAIEAASGEGGSLKQRFRKDIIRVGHWVHDSADMEFEVNSKTLNHWVDQFARMKENGVRVPIPSTHEGAGDPDKQRGYVDDMFVEDDRLVAICTLTGKDGIEAASRNDVSIFAPVRFVDGKGNEYKQPIRHVALTPEPLIPGLGPFVPIAASLGSTKTMNVKELAKKLGISGDVTEDNFVEMVKKHFAAKEKEAKEKTKKEVEASLKQDKPNDPKPALINDHVVGIMADNRSMKLDGLVQSGKISKAVRDKLAEQFIGEKNGAIKASLSKDPNANDGFDSIVASLKENHTFKMGEGTGPQGGGNISASEDVLKPEKNPVLKDAERRAEAAKAN